MHDEGSHLTFRPGMRMYMNIKADFLFLLDLTCQQLSLTLFAETNELVGDNRQSNFTKKWTWEHKTT